MNILITGGAGFIASHIADAYIQLKHRVFIIDNLSTGSEKNVPSGAKLIKMDITSPEVKAVFLEEKIDILNHHAAQMDVRFSVANPMFDANSNIIGGLNLFEAAKDTHVKKIIFASSGGAIYGDGCPVPSPETSPLEPCSPYGIAKLTTEKYLAFYKNTYGIDCVCLRYANIYGPRQNHQGEAGVVAIFINKMLTGQQPIINGDGLNARDYVFVKDVVRANVIALNEDTSGIFNIGTEVQTNVNQIFNYLKERINPNCPETHGEAKSGEQRVSCISYQKIKTMHKWEPLTNLKDGLDETVRYFKENQ